METPEIKKIRAQFQAGLWPQLVEMVEIEGLRGWSGQTMNFNFPVVAIVGENGTGKSTLLKAVACAYENKDQSKTYYPSTFFPATRWDSVQGVTLTYRVRTGNETKTYKIKKPASRWSLPTRANRDVFIFDISRTVPLDASAGYAKIARLAASEVSTSDIEDEYRKKLSFVLGRNYANARFATSDVDNRRQVGILKREFGEISQFHQGAGEDTTLDLFRALQSIPPNSLLIIDEVEASLHPKAQRRLTRVLLELSRLKRIQVVLSTHSPYVLEELPQEARVLLIPGPTLNIVYGVTPEFSMSRIDENVHPELVLFVEDREAALWLREMIAMDPRGMEIISRVDIVPVGASNVVKMLGELGVKGRLPYKKSLAVFDGDQTKIDGCTALPGSSSPEEVVFADLKATSWKQLDMRFGIGAGDLFTFLEDAMLEPDHHKWTKSIGDKTLKASSSVWEILCNQWCLLGCREPERKALVDSIIGALG